MRISQKNYSALALSLMGASGLTLATETPTSASSLAAAVLSQTGAATASTIGGAVGAMVGGATGGGGFGSGLSALPAGVTRLALPGQGELVPLRPLAARQSMPGLPCPEIPFPMITLPCNPVAMSSGPIGFDYTFNNNIVAGLALSLATRQMSI